MQKIQKYQLENMFSLTVLAAGSVEAGRTVTELGGSLSTLASVEAHTVTTDRCMCPCGQTKQRNDE